MKQTKKHALKLFEGADNLDYNVLNENWNTIDELLVANGMRYIGAIGTKETLDGVSADIGSVAYVSEQHRFYICLGERNWALFSDNTSNNGTSEPGKSAYQYAQEGGFTGTEEEFGALLARYMTDGVMRYIGVSWQSLMNDIKGDDKIGCVVYDLDSKQFHICLGDTWMPIAQCDSYTLTETDKAAIVAEVLDAINNGDVVGYVDENNDIVVSGKLDNGTYTVKYELEDGTIIDIGELVLSQNEPEEPEEPEEPNDPTNFFDSSTGFYGRLSQNGENRTDSANTFVTNYIQVQSGDVVSVSGCNIAAIQSGSDTYFTSCYNSEKGHLASAKNKQNNAYITFDEATNTNAQITVTGSDVAYIRFTCGVSGRDSASVIVDTSSIVINIKRNDAWL